jgi:hypothetical protein
MGSSRAARMAGYSPVISPIKIATLTARAIA